MEPKEPNQGQMEEINLKPVPNAEVTFLKKYFIFFSIDSSIYKFKYYRG